MSTNHGSTDRARRVRHRAVATAAPTTGRQRAPQPPPDRQVFAAIDAGSNALRLQIVSVRASGVVVELESIREPVRLGHRVFLTGLLEEAEMDRAVSVLAAFRATMDRHRVCQYRAIATSAVREAQNRDLFVHRVSSVAKVEMEVISGAEEARLLAVAVQHRVPLEKKSALLVDIGGGSVELAAVKGGRTLLSQSHRLGAVRLYELFCEGSRAAEEKATLLEEYLDRMLKETLREVRRIRPELLLAVGGNAETLARIADGKETPQGNFVAVPDLSDVTERLLALTATERARKYDLRPDRVDTIVPAATLLNFLVRKLDLRGFHSPRVGLRDALLSELVDQALGGVDARKVEEGVLMEAERLGEHFRYDAAHAHHVRKMALAIFDSLRADQKLSARDRVLLGVAATLHDIGEFVGYAHHHKHGYYLISNSELGGLTNEEMRLVAVAIRYHRRAHPTDRHPEFALLSRDDRKRVSRLAAILRVADALDREHRQKVRGLTAAVRRGELWLSSKVDGDPALESWAIENKRALFKEVFGMPVRWEWEAAGASNGRGLPALRSARGSA